jgi:hypothetical protein
MVQAAAGSTYSSPPQAVAAQARLQAGGSYKGLYCSRGLATVGEVMAFTQDAGAVSWN